MNCPISVRRIIWLLAAGLTALVFMLAVLSVSVPVQDAGAQVLRTRVPGGLLSGGQRPTIAVPTFNVASGALSTLAAGAAGVLSNPAYPEMAATAEALWTQAAGLSSEAVVTAEYLATQAYTDWPAIQATAAYIATAAVEYDWGALSADVIAAVEEVLSTAIVTFDPATNAFQATTIYSEAMLNSVLDASLAAMGFDPAQVAVDLIPGGMVVTVTGYEAGQAVGTLVVTLALNVVDGQLTYSVVSATIAGIAVPSIVMQEIEALFQEVPLETLLLEMLVGELSAYGEVGYAVQDLLITDTELYLTVTFWFVPGT